MLGSFWSTPLLALTVLTGVAALLALARQRFRLARAFHHPGELIIVGWGLAHSPALIAPDVTLHGSAAPEATLRLLLPVIAAVAVLLFPSLYLLLRIFKRPA